MGLVSRLDTRHARRADFILLFTLTILTFCRGTQADTTQDGTQEALRTEKVMVDADGRVQLQGVTVPFSDLASSSARRNFLDLVHGNSSACKDVNTSAGNIKEVRKQLDDCYMRPGVEKLRSTFRVDIKSQKIGGVRSDVIEPTAGISEKNRRRVLINLHGGGFMVAAGLGGQMESIPIAGLAAIKVITVDYRQGPEYRFPVASEDVAAVYRELLDRGYSAKNIGIYGCSAGGMLAAQSIAWFQAHGLPRPGAIGIFGAGALIPMVGDSKYLGSLLVGASPEPEDAKKFLAYFDVQDLDIKSSLVSPAYSPSVLANFPPTLLISGTRDVGLSPAVYTHSQLVKEGVIADLHVWEGATHCSFAQPVVDPSEPETREAWDVIVRFFDKHLGK